MAEITQAIAAPAAKTEAMLSRLMPPIAATGKVVAPMIARNVGIPMAAPASVLVAVP
jgi:hypothetical protein